METFLCLGLGIVFICTGVKCISDDFSERKW